MAHPIQSQVFNATLDTHWSESDEILRFDDIRDSIKQIYLKNHCNSNFTIESFTEIINNNYNDLQFVLKLRIIGCMQRAFGKAQDAAVKAPNAPIAQVAIAAQPPLPQSQTQIFKSILDKDWSESDLKDKYLHIRDRIKEIFNDNITSDNFVEIVTKIACDLEVMNSIFAVSLAENAFKKTKETVEKKAGPAPVAAKPSSPAAPTIPIAQMPIATVPPIAAKVPSPKWDKDADLALIQDQMIECAPINDQKGIRSRCSSPLDQRQTVGITPTDHVLDIFQSELKSASDRAAFNRSMNDALKQFFLNNHILVGRGLAFNNANKVLQKLYPEYANKDKTENSSKASVKEEAITKAEPKVAAPQEKKGEFGPKEKEKFVKTFSDLYKKRCADEKDVASNKHFHFLVFTNGKNLRDQVIDTMTTAANQAKTPKEIKANFDKLLSDHNYLNDKTHGEVCRRAVYIAYGIMEAALTN
jgi:hypothetical protein